MVWRIVVFIVFSLPVCAQQTPTVLRSALRYHESRENHDSVSYYLAALGYHYLQEKSYDSSKYYHKKSIQYNRRLKNDERLAENLNNMGVLYLQTNFLDSSIHYFNEALARYKVVDDTSNTAIIEVNLGILYKEKGLYEKSLQFLLSASRKLEKKQHSETLASCYNSIGNLYLKLLEPDVALRFHYRALFVRQELTAEGPIAGSYNNIGNVYILLKKYDSAVNNFTKSLSIKRKLRDQKGEAITLNNLGDVMLHSGELRQAEMFYKQSLSIRLAIKDRGGQVTSRNSLGRVYLLNNKIKEAEGELMESEKLATSMGLLYQLKEIYENQISLYKKKDELEKALQYSQQLIIVKDSLLNQEKAQTLAEMQTRYETEKKEDRITLLEKEGMLQSLEIERKQIWIRSLILAMGLTLVIGILIYFNLRMVRKNKLHIETLLKELHHRVKNNLQILSSLLSLQSQQLTDDSAIKAVKSSESRINAMALIHRKLYTVDQNRTVDIKEYITELIQYLVYSYGYHEKDLKLDLRIREINIDVDKAIPLGLILNELISNAFKHAYENQPNPKLMVNLEYPDVHELNIQIQDNGGGIGITDPKRKTFGMKMVSTLIKELKGTLNVKSENGTTYVLHIPI